MSMSQEAQSDLLTPSIGAAVTTSDGSQFAYVKAVKGGYFELDVPMARDFWLSRQYIASTNDRQVSLNIDRDEVDEHRLGAPGLEELEDPHRATAQDRMLSHEEVLTQRERMERELLAQRARMEKELAEEEGVIDPGYRL